MSSLTPNINQQSVYRPTIFSVLNLFQKTKPNVCSQQLTSNHPHFLIQNQIWLTTKISGLFAYLMIQNYILSVLDFNFMQHPNPRTLDKSRFLQNQFLWMTGFYKLAIDLQENGMVLIGIFSKFDKERSFSLHYLFSKTQIKCISQGLFQTNLARIFKADEFQLPIRVGRLSGCFFRLDVLIFLGFFPNISHSPHIAVDVQGKQILVIVKTSYFFDSFNKVSEIEAEWVFDVVEETFIVAFKNSFPRSHFHYLYKFAQSFSLLQTCLDSHHPIHRQITQPSRCSVFVKLITDFSVNSKTEIVAKVLADAFAWEFAIFAVFNFGESAVLEHLNYDFPQIQVLTFCTLPVPDQLLQLSKRILSESGLRGSPSQISRKVIARAKWNDRNANFFRIDLVLGNK